MRWGHLKQSHQAGRDDSRVASSGSDAAAGGEPARVENEIRLFEDEVVMGVVVEHPDAGCVGDRGNQEIDRRDPVMAGAGQLELGVERSGPGRLVGFGRRKAREKGGAPPVL